MLLKFKICSHRMVTIALKKVANNANKAFIFVII